MSFIEYTIENKPAMEDDKIIRDGIVHFNSQTLHEQATRSLRARRAAGEGE